MTKHRLLEAFFERANTSPDQPFLVSDEGDIDYGEAAQVVERMARILRKGPSDAIVLTESTPRFRRISG